MANLENPYIAPIYVSVTNTVTPLATITVDALYRNAVSFLNILQIFIQTAYFIVKEGIVAAFANASGILENLTLEKIVYIIGVYNLFMMAALDNQRKKIAEQKKLIEYLEKNVSYLKKTERTREDLHEMWIQDVKSYHADTSKQMVAMEKKIKKLEKDLKQYE